MLITLPDFDETTSYLSAWSEDIIRTAERNNIRPIPIRGRKVTRSRVEAALKKHNPSFICFNGHGSDIAVGGHDNEPLITLGKNDSLLDSKIVHALSCSAARELGKNCKACAFIGYDGIFWLYMDGNKVTRPLQDRKVKPILESALEAPKQIVKRKTAGEAFEKSQEKYQKFIDELTLSSSKHTADELQVVLPFLHANKNYQRMFGDKNARV